MKTQVLIREERNAYLREWRKKNPSKVKEYNERYWCKKAKQRQEQERTDETEKQ